MRKALGHGEGEAALCTPHALEPPVSSAEQERPKEGRASCCSAGLCSLEDPCVWCRANATGLLRPPSLSVLSSVTVEPLCQRTDWSRRAAFLLRSVLEQLPARETQPSGTAAGNLTQ